MEETFEVLLQLSPGARSRLIDLKPADGTSELGSGQLQVLLLQLHDNTAQSAASQLIQMPLLMVGGFSIPLSHQLHIHRQGDCDFLLQAKLGEGSSAILLCRLETGLKANQQQTLQQIEQLFAHYCYYELPQYRQQLAAVDERSGQIVCLFDNQSYKTVSEGQLLHQQKQNEQPYMLIEMTGGKDQRLQQPAQPQQERSVSRRAADKAVETTARISDAMISQAARLGNSIKSGTLSVKSRISPRQPVRISATVKQRAANISNYTRMAAQLTGAVARTAIASAEMFGSYLGALLRSHHSTAQTMEKYRDVRYLLAQSVVAAANLARGVEQSIRLIACEAGQATIELAGWKYGDEVREVLQHAVDSAGQVSLVYFDSRGLSRRAVVRLADEAIKPVVENPNVSAVAAVKKLS